MNVLERTPECPVLPGSWLQFRVLPAAEIDDNAVSCWRDLLRRSCHQNPFLAPEFVLPAWRWLAPDQQLAIFFVESRNDGRWLAAGLASRSPSTRTIPWPHLVTFNCHYTCRTGLLIDAECVPECLEVLLLGIRCGGWKQQTFVIPGLRLDSTLARELSAAARRLHFTWQTPPPPRNVPAVFPAIVSEEYLSERWSASRRKSLRRSKAKLESTGPVQLRLRTGPDEVEEALETFLKLEHDSWKGINGTACRSNARDEAFIREMVMGMAGRNCILISELCAGNQVVVSAVNLVAGTGLFAFKIGWDKAWAAASPGVLHEAELLLAARDRLQDFTLFDSCATEGSYIAPIWPERIPVATGILCMSPWSQWCHQALLAGRSLRRWIMRGMRELGNSNRRAPE